jgi:plasmid stability protein
MLSYVVMGVLLQIRDVPEEVHRTLKARAAASGTSLSEYVREVLARAAARPTPEELAARIGVRGTVRLEEPSERSVRRLRERGE